MKPTLYLHIGTNKTGSTALQNFFELNKELLAEKGVNYPLPHGSPSSGARNFHFQFGNGFYLVVNHSQYRIDKEQALLDYLPGDKDAILSCELLWGEQVSTYERIQKLLGERYTIKVVVYFRRADSFYSSWLQQSIQSQGRYTMEVDEVVPYTAKLDALAEIFGQENIVVRCYEKQQFVGGTIFQDFLSVLGITDITEYDFPTSAVNPSFEPEYLEMRRLLNHPLLFPDADKILNGDPLPGIQAIFSHALAHMSNPDDKPRYFKKPTLLSPQQRRELIDQHAEEYGKIAQKYLGREDGTLFYDDEPQADDAWEPPAVPPTEKVVQGFGLVLCDMYKQIETLQKQVRYLMQDREMPRQKNELTHFSLGMPGRHIIAGVPERNVTIAPNAISMQANGPGAFIIFMQPLQFEHDKTYLLEVEVTAPAECETTLYLGEIIGEEYRSKWSQLKFIRAGDNRFTVTIGGQDGTLLFAYGPGNAPGFYQTRKLNIVEIDHQEINVDLTGQRKAA